MRGNTLQIGQVIGGNDSLILPPSARERHLYVCGGTGVGKSKFLEACVRQDILNWSNSHCGLILFDPHGLVYQNILSWLARHGLKRPIVPIDLRRDDWIISYNLLRKRKETDAAVVVSNFVRALSHVWGQGGTDQTPLFARWAGVIFQTLYETGYTISDVMHLFSRPDFRRKLSGKLRDDTARYAWEFADRQPKEFEQQVTSTLNRFQRLLGPAVMRATFGQSDVSLDLLTALEEGHIILVNLSTEGGQIDEEDADTFATLMLTDLWSAAKARGKQERHKTRPFYVYLDECQNFVTPTIAQNLDQARGFGLHLTLANQFPSQFLNAGQHGKAMYDSVLANAGTKVVFRVEHPEDMKQLAQWLFMSTLDTDQVKLRLMTTKVIGYKEELKESSTSGKTNSYGSSSTDGGGTSQGEARDARIPKDAEVDFDKPFEEELETIENWNRQVSKSTGGSTMWSTTQVDSNSTTESVTRTPTLIPIMGQEVSSVQYRSVDEQLFRSMQTLFGQADRHFAVRFAGGPKAPLFVKTPTVPQAVTSRSAVEKYRENLLKRLSFALPMAEALRRRSARDETITSPTNGIHSSSEEPTVGRRRVR